MLRLATVILLAACALTGCSESSGNGNNPDDGGDEMTTTKDDLVCGLIDQELVKRITGEGEIGTRGPGIRSREQRTAEPANCTVQDEDRSTTVLQVSAGEVQDVTQWRTKLAAEAAAEPGCTEYSGDPGVGYGCTYDSGLFVDGAGVHVLSGDRLIRVTVHHWPDVTPEERLALAEEIARNVDQNVTAFDAQDS